jgi:hypothetical protein
MFADIKKVVDTARENFDKLLFEIREIKAILKRIEQSVRKPDSRGLPPL